MHHISPEHTRKRASEYVNVKTIKSLWQNVNGQVTYLPCKMIAKRRNSKMSRSLRRGNQESTRSSLQSISMEQIIQCSSIDLNFCSSSLDSRERERNNLITMMQTSPREKFSMHEYWSDDFEQWTDARTLQYLQTDREQIFRLNMFFSST